MSRALRLRLLPGRYRVARLPATAPLPAWALVETELLSITRTADELSVLCAAERIPEGLPVGPDQRALAVVGPLDFALTGILAELAGALAAAQIPIFVVSTHDTDVLLVPEPRLDAARAALTAAGHEIC